MIEEWIDCIFIWYSNQVPLVADDCKILHGSMAYLGNYDNMFFKCYVSCDVSEKNGLILVLTYLFVTKKHTANGLGIPKLRYSLLQGLILFIFDTLSNHSRDLIHVKYTLALCPNVSFMSIIS